MPLNTFHDDDGQLTLYHGDALEVSRELPDKSVDCIVTSPPYYGLRDYGSPGQYGIEPEPRIYVKRLRELFTELRRALADEGTLWLNLGDSYSDGTPLPAKNLIGIPWRVALALQDDGWILRNDIIWHAPNKMPQSVTDRCCTKHEYVFMFTKKQQYWFDLNSIREPAVQAGRKRADQMGGNKGHKTAHSPGGIFTGSDTRNPGSVWSITTKPFPGAHFAVMPLELAQRCIKAGCKPGGTVLDPFSGSGTTGLAAQRLGRRYIGVDLNDEYLKLSLHDRLDPTSMLDFADSTLP